MIPDGTRSVSPSHILLFNKTDAIKSVTAGETAETLWGADKGDPKDGLAENGFKMKRIVLTRPPGSGGGGGGGRGRRGGGKKQEKASE